MRAINFPLGFHPRCLLVNMCAVCLYYSKRNIQCPFCKFHRSILAEQNGKNELNFNVKKYGNFILFKCFKVASAFPQSVLVNILVYTF